MLATEPHWIEGPVAIITPGNIVVSPQYLERWDKSWSLKALGPPPADDDDDFAHLPLEPYDPKDPIREWAKAEAWIEEEDSDGDMPHSSLHLSPMF